MKNVTFGAKRTIDIPVELMNLYQEELEGQVLHSCIRTAVRMYLYLRRRRPISIKFETLGECLDLTDQAVVSCIDFLCSHGLLSAEWEDDGWIRRIEFTSLSGATFQVPGHLVDEFIRYAPPGCIDVLLYIFCVEQGGLTGTNIYKTLSLVPKQVDYMVSYWVAMDILRWNGIPYVEEPVLKYVKVLHNAKFLCNKYATKTDDEMFYLPFVANELPPMPFSAYMGSDRHELEAYRKIRIDLDFTVRLTSFLYEFCFDLCIVDPWEIVRIAESWHAAGITSYRKAVLLFGERKL